MVYHILKDGSVVNDVSGRIVKLEDAKTVYDLMDSINGSRTRKRKNKTTKNN